MVIFFFTNIGLFVEQVCQLILELFNLKRETVVATFIPWGLHVRLNFARCKNSRYDQLQWTEVEVQAFHRGFGCCFR